MIAVIHLLVVRIRDIRSIFVLLLWFFVPLQTTTAQATTETIIHDGLERVYHVYVPPSYNGENPVPLVVALHPAASSGKAMESLTGLDRAADEYGFVVVYPKSYGLVWADGRAEVNTRQIEEPRDDVGFISALVRHLLETYNIDSERIYLTGHSVGGGLAYRLACEMPEQFAAVAVVGTLMWNYHLDVCPKTGEPVTMLIVHGSEDATFPMQGRLWQGEETGTYNLRTLSIYETMDFWLTHNGCDADVIDMQPESHKLTFSDCVDDTTVNLLVANGAGHGWFRMGDYRLNQYGADATRIISRFFAGETDWAQPQTEVVDHAEQEQTYPRSFRYYVPSSYNPDMPTPLVVVLHGRPDNGTGIAYITDMNPVAEREGFIALYPDGLDFSWNYYYWLQGPNATDYPFQEINDTQFLRDLIADISIDLNIDQQRIYVTGFSNGGFMTQLLACEASDLFAAFAPVGSALFPSLTDVCEQKHAAPAPMLFIHGTEDVSIPWTGISDSRTGLVVSYPVSQTLGFWADFKGCSLEADYEEMPESGESPGTRVLYHTFPDCDDDKPLIFYMIGGGGHNWPGVPGRVPERIAGLVNMDIHASEVIWEFFEQFERESD